MKILGVEVLPNGLDRWRVLKGDHPYLYIPRKNGDVLALKESLLDNSLQPVVSDAKVITLDLSHQLPAI